MDGICQVGCDKKHLQIYHETITALIHQVQLRNMNLYCPIFINKFPYTIITVERVGHSDKFCLETINGNASMQINVACCGVLQVLSAAMERGMKLKLERCIDFTLDLRLTDISHLSEARIRRQRDHYSCVNLLI